MPGQISLGYPSQHSHCRGTGSIQHLHHEIVKNEESRRNQNLTLETLARPGWRTSIICNEDTYTSFRHIQNPHYCIQKQWKRYISHDPSGDARHLFQKRKLRILNSIHRNAFPKVTWSNFRGRTSRRRANPNTRGRRQGTQEEIDLFAYKLLAGQKAVGHELASTHGARLVGHGDGAVLLLLLRWSGRQRGEKSCVSLLRKGLSLRPRSPLPSPP